MRTDASVHSLTIGQLAYQAHALGLAQKARNDFVSSVAVACFGMLREMLIELLGLRLIRPKGSADDAWTPLVALIANPELARHVQTMSTGGGAISNDELHQRLQSTQEKLQAGQAIFPAELLDMMPADERGRWAHLVEGGGADVPSSQPVALAYPELPADHPDNALEFDPATWLALARRA